MALDIDSFAWEPNLITGEKRAASLSVSDLSAGSRCKSDVCSCRTYHGVVGARDQITLEGGATTSATAAAETEGFGPQSIFFAPVLPFQKTVRQPRVSTVIQRREGPAPAETIRSLTRILDNTAQ